MAETIENYQRILEKLNSVRKKSKKETLLQGSALFLTVVIITLTLLIAADAVFRLNSYLRTMAMVGFILSSGAGLVWFLVRPLMFLLLKLPKPSDEYLAGQIGQRFPSLKDRLLNALQVFAKRTNNPEGYSLALTETSVGKVWELVKNLDFEKIVDFKKVRKAGRILIVSLLPLLFFVGFLSSSFRASVYRVFHPTTDFVMPPKFTLEVEPGNAEILEGEDVAIVITSRGQPPKKLSLFLREGERKEFTEKILLAETTGHFRYTIQRLKDPVEYFVGAGGIRSENYRISVVKRPMVRNLQVELIYPFYSKLGARYQEENVGDVTALFGTQVKLKIKANKIIKKAKLIFESGASKNMIVRGSSAEGNFTVAHDDKYHVYLEDSKGNANRDPIQYRVKTVADQFPIVKITQPGMNVDLGEDMVLPIKIEAEDDFGISKIRLGYRVTKSEYYQIPQDTAYQFLPLDVSAEEEPKATVDYSWDLSSLQLMPEDVVSYFAEAFDNDRVSGPKRAASRTYTARFPSVQEIYAEVEREQGREIETMEEIAAESRKLKEKLEQVVQQMQRDAHLDWSEKQDLTEAVKKQQELAQKVEEVSARLDELIERMEKNDLLSLETLQKYEELQRLFEEIATPELRKAMEELRKALEQMDPEELKRAVEKFNLSQEDFLKTLERTLSIFKRLQLEQKMDQAVKLAEELLRRQQELNEEIKATPEEELESLSQRQNKLGEDTESLRKSLADLKNKMEEFANMPIPLIESALENAEEVKAEIEKIKGMMVAGQKQATMTAAMQTEASLTALSERLKQAQQQMRRNEKKEVMEALRRSSYELLRLSEQQEELKRRSQQLSRGSAQFGELAEQQLGLLNGLSRVTKDLYKLSQKTFFVTPEIGRAIGKSLANMQKALNSLEQRNGYSASGRQGSALGGLNEAIWQIRNSMNSLSAAASALGMEEFLKRLQNMASQQQGINQQTLGLENLGVLTLKQQAALARLAAEQEALRKSLEQLRREMGNRSEILGRLEGAAREMEKVVKDLEKRNVDRKTIERQRRILSRLLDAQRSLRQRDYSRRRKAETGKKYFVRSPQEIPEEIIYSKDKLREDILRAKKEGYTADYLELIRKYFEALAREQ